MDAGAWGLISVTWKGEKERQIHKGPCLLCCPRTLLSRTPPDARQSRVPLWAGLSASAGPLQLEQSWLRELGWPDRRCAYGHLLSRRGLDVHLGPRS